MKKLFFLFLAFLLIFSNLKAGEGIWLPLLLEQMNEKEMQDMGMKITAKDIYDINNSSLKDAIVIFGGGCTGEIVSSEGLLLTNHHCGYGSIQKHSTLEHNYLDEGFWAMNRDEELPNPGLSVTFLISMEDVTEKTLEGVTSEMSEDERRKKIKENSKIIKEEAIKDTHYKAVLKPFYNGNKYYLFVNEVFTDVRLVGAPPSSIGKFGGDTDNWMWPRHTGDFSVFRVYADSANNPAPYSVNNVPYQPKKHLEISLEGVEEGDFTFVFGYPGTTNEYATSYEVDNIVNKINPIRIDLRTQRLQILAAEMENDPLVRIQYSAKYAGIANGWKKMQGESKGIARNSAIEKKQDLEKSFITWANSNANNKKMYGNLIPAFETSYAQMRDYDYAFYYLIEAGLGVELFRFANSFGNLIRKSKDEKIDNEEIQKIATRQISAINSFYKDYVPSIDEKVCAKMLSAYSSDLSAEFQPAILIELNKKYKGDFNSYAAKLMKKSIFAHKEKLIALMENYKRKDYKKLEKDMAYSFISQTLNFYRTHVQPEMSILGKETDSLQRIYMKGLMEMQKDKRFYPDANFTMRITYGNVAGYEPADGVAYKHYTTLDGIMEKENPDIYDYKVEDKLKELYKAKDYGRYADKDGKMHVGFIGTNHTTGGNSGSPVLDANGRLIGLNFDRAWEGTMSDLNYDPRYCRNITVDIRYCLFIMDKFANAGHLVDEMTIVEEK